MATKYYIRAGFVESNQPPKAGGNVTGPNAPLSNGRFDLHYWLKRELASLSVSAVDACCTPDPTNLPMRYNQTAGKLQYLNAGIWTNLTTF